MRTPVRFAACTGVVLVSLAACGSEEAAVDAGVELEERTDDTLPFDEEFCPELEVVLEQDPNRRSEDGFDVYVGELAALRAAAPEDVQSDVEALIGYVKALRDKAAPYGHDAEAYLQDLDPDAFDDHQELYQPVYEVFAESALARYAHRSCGWDDPAFALACATEFTEDVSADTVTLEEHVDRELSMLPEGTTTKSRSASPREKAQLGSVDVAYLDGDGTTIRTTRYSAVDTNRYQQVSSQVCPD